jgi:hypothetical protein
MRRLLVGTVLVPCAAGVRAADHQAPVVLGDEGTIVFYGDSITERHLYPACLERPTLVFLDFGMNDGGYEPLQPRRPVGGGTLRRRADRPRSQMYGTPHVSATATAQ